jgi:hypothetical protein
MAVRRSEVSRLGNQALPLACGHHALGKSQRIETHGDPASLMAKPPHTRAAAPDQCRRG